jgi:hypothetical protein
MERFSTPAAVEHLAQWSGSGGDGRGAAKGSWHWAHGSIGREHTGAVMLLEGEGPQMLRAVVGVVEAAVAAAGAANMQLARSTRLVVYHWGQGNCAHPHGESADLQQQEARGGQNGMRWVRMPLTLRLFAGKGGLVFSLGGDDLATLDLAAGSMWWCDPIAEGRYIFPGMEDASHSPTTQRMHHRVEPVQPPPSRC